jgi:MerR family copper efflux transcriptional regulator
VKQATKSSPERRPASGVEGQEPPESWPVNIGEAARLTGVSAKMIRHYEQIGLLTAAQRSFSGYRLYSEPDLHTLRFVRQARQLGFGINQIATLLDLWRDRGRPSAEVKALAQAHIDELDARIAELQRMRATLAALAHACHGDDRPDCPILEGLAGLTP